MEKKYVALTYSLSLYNGSFYGKDLKTCIAQMQKLAFCISLLYNITKRLCFLNKQNINIITDNKK